jgi:hypothetical protein
MILNNQLNCPMKQESIFKIIFKNSKHENPSRMYPSQKYQRIHILT